MLNLDFVADLADPPGYRDESVVHVSDLVSRAATLVGLPSYSSETTEAQRNIMALGRLWEAMVRPTVKELAESEGLQFCPKEPRVMNGVVGSLDGTLIKKGEPASRTYAVVETKSRWTDSGDPRDNFRWMAQVKAYCWMSMCTRAWMPVLYLPRRGPPNAEFVLHKLEFLPHELAENWQMLIGAGRYDNTENT